MRKPDENKLDKLFKDGFAGVEKPVEFREDDWTAMEKLLDKNSGKPAGLYRIIYYASGVAAVLLLALGLYFFAGRPSGGGKKQQNLTKQNTYQHKEHNDQSGQPSNHPVYEQPVNCAQLVNRSSRKSKSFFSLSAARRGRYRKAQPLPSPAVKNKPIVTDNGDTLTTEQLAANQQGGEKTTGNAIVEAAADTAKAAQLVAENTVKEKPENVEPLPKPRRQLTLSVLAAPDLNTSGSLTGGQLGANIGVQMGLQLTSHISVTTGVTYAAKPYQANGFNYTNTFRPPVTPTRVAANCKVLDIPVNINYRVYSKGGNSLLLGTGLSSYLMLRERYRFDYDNNPAMSPFRLDIANQNQHWFGVLNLNATYQRRINNKLSLVAQPYLKLPLTGIGNGQVNLRSSGVALGIGWNFNTFKTPK